MQTKQTKLAAVVVGAAAMALALPGSAFAGATQIDSGISNTCAVKSGTGKVICWGSGSAKTVPSSVGAATQVSVGATSACAIKKSNSKVVCWGSNTKGQRTVPSTLGAVSQVSVGSTWACAIKKADSNAVCWGRGNSSYAVVTVPASLGAVSEIAANEGDTDAAPVCAIRKSNGSIGCWGGSWDTDLNKAYVPFWTAAQDATGLRGLAGKNDCAIVSATGTLVASYDIGTVFPPGENGPNKLTGGVSGTQGGCPFVPQSLAAVSQVARGFVVTCAIKVADSTVSCWTSVDDGDITSPAALPVASSQTTVPASLGPVSAVTVGGTKGRNADPFSTAPDPTYSSTCAIQKTVVKKVVCWGSTHYKQTAVPSTL